MSKHQYQDLWVKGQAVHQGIRECEARYQILRDYCQQFQRPFSVLDIGANFGYFCFRLAEDFPCHATMIERDPICADQLFNLCVKNEMPNTAFLQHSCSLDTLRMLGEVEHFDVVMGLSVIHYLGEPSEVISTLRTLGEHLIVELPVEPNAANPSMVKQIQVPDDAKFLGTAPSHIGDYQRPFYVMHTPKPSLKKPYIGKPHFVASDTVRIDSSFAHKQVEFSGKKCSIRADNHRAWQPGINLMTYWNFGGRYPRLDDIETAVEGLDYRGHGDIRPWNILLTHEGVRLIDSRKTELLPSYQPEHDEHNLVATLDWVRNTTVAPTPLQPVSLGSNWVHSL
jgi:hypothetical protein